VISIQGPSSLDTLNGVANQVVARLSTVPGLTDVATSLPPEQPELHIVVDRQRADAAGISPVLVGSTIRSVFQSTTATQVDWQDHRLDVVVQLRDQDLNNTAALMNLPIVSPTGTSFPLSAVAQVQQGSGPTVLSRQNQLEQIVVGANLEGRTQGQVMPDVQKAMAGLTLPAGDTWNYSGQQAQTQSAFGSLIFALILGLVFVYMVLASQFGSFIHPFTVMAALPLAAVGSVLAMVVTHTELTIISMIGLILMMGLATKNSILLVDFIIRHRKQGQARTQAVLSAGPLRLRPILMTTFAIIFGMIPTAMGMGASGAFRAPMAIAVIGGVFSSALLSLVAVPVIYTIIDDGTVFVVRLFRREPAVSPASEPAPPAVSQPEKSAPALNSIAPSIDVEVDPPADD
jgi:HAE1 family hydrophobic/amphiphilic exporter-1